MFIIIHVHALCDHASKNVLLLKKGNDLFISGYNWQLLGIIVAFVYPLFQTITLWLITKRMSRRWFLINPLFSFSLSSRRQRNTYIKQQHCETSVAAADLYSSILSSTSPISQRLLLAYLSKMPRNWNASMMENCKLLWQLIWSHIKLRLTFN